MVALQEPTHDSLAAATITIMDAQDQSVRFKVNERWTYLTYRPVQESETEFSSTPVAANFFMAMMINAPDATTSAAFEFEIYTNLEFSGSTVRGVTGSHVDLAGYSAVHTVAQISKSRLPHQEEINKKEKSFLQEVETYALKGLSWVWNHKEQLANVAMTAAALL